MASSAVETERLLVAENRKIKTFAKCHARNIFLQLKRQTFEFKINKYNNSNDATTTTMTENEEKIDLRFQCQARNKFFMIRVFIVIELINLLNKRFQFTENNKITS